MRKVRLIPAMALRNRLIPFIVFRNLSMNCSSSVISDPALDKKGERISVPFPLFWFYF
jgi:hypothetical protein